MKQFFSTFFASLLALVVFVAISGLCSIIFFAMMIASMEKSKNVSTIEYNSILKIDLSCPIVEYNQEDNISSDINELLLGSKKVIGLNQIREKISKAALDPDISALYIKIDNPTIGYASAIELIEYIDKFKESKKPVICYGENYDNIGFLVSSVANKSYINPNGNFEVCGISMQTMYYKDLLDKLGIDMQVLRHGKYKSAVEPYLSNQMSKENREQSQKLVDNLWDNLCYYFPFNTDDQSQKEFDEMIDNLSLYANTKACVEKKLIDGRLSNIELEKLFKELLSTDELNVVDIANYNPIVSKKKLDEIAILYLEGEISSSRSNENHIDCNQISKAIDQIKENEDIKALVLRINSPGGSAFDAEIIYQKLKELDIPIVASFGDYAASGGYYIACAADSIFSNCSTITGSIGVFGVIPCAEKLIKKNLNVNIETVSSNKNSGLFSLANSLSNEQTLALQQSIENVYDLFLSHVCDARKLSYEQADSLAQGRVYCGNQAWQIGLVDQLGSIYAAIEKASQMSNTDRYNIVEYPKEELNFSNVLGLYTKIKTGEILLDNLGEYSSFAKDVNNVKKLEGVQCRMPFIKIK